VPPAEAGALRDDWERRAAIVESYREAAGITDPAQAIGPVPSGIPQLREAFHASVVALQLPDDQALLRAMGRGELEARVATHDRAMAVAPRDVQPEIGERERDWQRAQAHAHAARYAMDAEAAAEAEARASDAAEDLARLAIADAARREWAEAHAGQGEAAREAEAELRRRDQADQVARSDGPAQEQQVETDAEFDARLDRMVADAEARAAAAKAAEPEARPEPQAEPEPERAAEPVPAGDADVGQERHIEAEALHEAEPAAAAAEPVDPEQERFLEDVAEIRGTVDAIDAEVERMPDSETTRRAEVEEAGINEPVMHEPQAEPELESAWQPGMDAGHDEAAADAEAEVEM
jgi:colicin import membrane protein